MSFWLIREKATGLVSLVVTAAGERQGAAEALYRRARPGPEAQDLDVQLVWGVTPGACIPLEFEADA